MEKFFQEKTNAGFGKKKILIIIAAVIIALGAGGAFRAVQAKTFPKSTKINGVDVSGLNKKEAEEKINKESNRVTIVEDGKEPTDVETMYTYDTDAALQKKLMLSSLDPRLWVGVGVNFKGQGWCKRDGGSPVRGTSRCGRRRADQRCLHRPR